MGFFKKIFGGKDLTLREPEFAGMLYPADADELREELETLLAEANGGDEPPRALVVPHAEYTFAGPVMAEAWASVGERADAIERVVVVGTSRLVPFRGLAVTGFDGFSTPLGPIVAERDAVEALARLEQVRAIEPAFDPEESVEAQLPFARYVLGDVALVALMVGDATDEEVEEVLSDFLDDEATLVVVSANLSHDVSAERAESLDEETCRAIEALDPEAVSREHSNARVAIRGLLRAARSRGMQAKLLDRRTSADTAGAEGGPITGYGAFIFV